MNIKKFFVSAAIMISVAFAQAGSISGVVVDSNGSFPLGGANVFLEGTDKGGITDNEGKVYILDVPVGDYTVIVSYIGFDSFEQSVSVQENSTINFLAFLSAGVIEGSDVNVLGNSLSSQARALNSQKNKVNVSNIVSADQIGKFPDSNIGDALKRVPGIVVYNDQGEARFGHVRGTPSQFNSATINGERMPSAEAEIRSNQLDLIPADMIQTIEVIKALTPDMDADAIGGSINLITRKATGPRTSLTFGVGQNQLEEAGEISQLSAVYSNRALDNKLGYMFNFSYYDNWLGSDNVEAEWDDEGELQEMDIRKYLVHRERKSVGMRLDYNLGSTELYTDLNYNDRDDFENRYRLRTKDISDGFGEQEIRRQTKAGLPGNEYGRLEDQKLSSYKFGGTTLMNKLKLDYSLKLSEASEVRPNERYISMRLRDVTAIYNGNTNKPFVGFRPGDAIDLNSNWDLREITEEHQDTQEKATTFKFDVDYELSSSLKLETGFKNTVREKYRNNMFYEYEPVDEDAFLEDVFRNTASQTKDEWLNDEGSTRYESGRFVTRKFLGNLDLDNTSLFERQVNNEELAGNYDATEAVTAFYMMASYKASDRMNITGGVRMEQTSLTDLEARSYDADDDENTVVQGSDNDYSNVLPSLHMVYDMDELSKVRFAFTQSLARPNYFDIAPYQEVVREDEEIKVGNPELEPTLSSNIDLSYERYFEDVGIFSVGMFTKNITDFIAYTKGDVTSADNLPSAYNGFELEKAVNGGDASLVGYELAFQRQIFPGLGLYMNVTSISSKIDNLDPELQADRPDIKDDPMPGTSELSYNLSLSMDRGPLNVRLSMNHQGEFLEEYNDTAAEDRWYDEATFVDINASYRLRDNIALYADFNNLTNQPLRYYQGSSQYLMQEEYYNKKITIGIKADL